MTIVRYHLTLFLNAYHVCLDQEISYDQQVPIGGPHRPVWAIYGEYKYIVIHFPFFYFIYSAILIFYCYFF